MQYFLLTLFGLTCIWAIFRPGWAYALLLFFYPIDQVIGAKVPILMASKLGLQSINYIIGITTLCAAIRLAFFRPEPYRGYFNTSFLCVVLLYAWSIVTIWWSPGSVKGWEFFLGNWQGFPVFIIIGSFLLYDADDLVRAIRAALYLGTTLCIVILLSDEFQQQYGRIGVLFGKILVSNPLALGDLGASVLVIGALLRKNSLGKHASLIRLCAMILGAVVALKSGARGQVLVAGVVMISFFPLSAPVRSIGTFISTALGVILVALLLPTIASFLLEGIAAKRFTVEEMLYGSSSAGGRIENLRMFMAQISLNPAALFLGLGYFAFNALGGDVYSHVLVADCIFELGLPGAIMLLVILIVTYRACATLFRFYQYCPVERSAIAVIIAIAALLFILSNKQGELWSSIAVFMLFLSICRISRTLPDEPISSQSSVGDESTLTTDEQLELR